MNFLDIKFISLVSPHLRNFKHKSANLWNFSCPFCGDSQKKAYKARGYFFENKGSLLFKCHNCTVSYPFGAFLKKIDQRLHKEYCYEQLKETKGFQPKKNPEEEKPQLRKINQFVDFNNEVLPAKSFKMGLNFLVTRKIPFDKWDEFYYVEKYFEWMKKYIKRDYNLKSDHPRILIPYYDAKGKLFAFQARQLEEMDRGPKYLTVKLNEKTPLIYGLNRLKIKEHFYVVEGSIDSLYIPNCISITGLNLPKDLPLDCTIIFDNQPRHSVVIKKMEQCATHGFSVFIWPDKIEHKDINECVVAGQVKLENMKRFIDVNSYKGLVALANIKQWRKV